MEEINKDNNEIEQLKAQVELLTKLFGSNPLASNSSSSDDLIEFESTSIPPLYLSTEGNGKGEVYYFEEFGVKHNIPISHARDIVRHNKSFVQKGYVFINDEVFVSKENLTSYYKNIISASGLSNILLCKKEKFSERFSTLTETQKDTICNMLFNKLKDGKKVDEDILFYIHSKTKKNIAEEVSNLEKLINNED